MNAQPLVVFVHIRKTAGRSLRQLLYREYTRSRTVLVKNYFTQAAASEAFVRDLAAHPPPDLLVAHGHMLFWPDYPWPEGSEFFTMLRDPVDRVISHYYWLRSRSDRFQKSLSEAVQDGTIEDNLQTRVISAVMPPFGEMPQEALDLAVERLEKFSVVGLTERFDESVVLLTRTLEWRRTVYTRENVTANRKPVDGISDEELELIQQHNALDLELYAAARRHFKKQVQVQDYAFAIEVEALKRAVKRSATLEDTLTPRPLPSRIAVEGDGELDLRDLLIDAQADSAATRPRARAHDPDPAPRALAEGRHASSGGAPVEADRRRRRRAHSAGAARGSSLPKVEADPRRTRSPLRKNVEVTRERLARFTARADDIERQLAARPADAGRPRRHGLITPDSGGVSPFCPRRAARRRRFASDRNWARTCLPVSGSLGSAAAVADSAVSLVRALLFVSRRA